MKKIMVLAALLIMTSAISGCSQNETDKNNDKALLCEFTNPQTGSKLIPGEKFDISQNSETISYSEGASCYYDGMDKVFGYNGYNVTTYPAKDGDYISEIYITGTIKTPAGIGVGSTVEDLTNAYGKDYTVDGKNYKYSTGGDKYVYFFISNNAVKGYGYAKEVK